LHKNLHLQEWQKNKAAKKKIICKLFLSKYSAKLQAFFNA
jgi:hypothetical protein